MHGDLNARHLLRRSSDGLPVLLEGGGVQRAGTLPPGAISMILGSPLLSCSAGRQARTDAGPSLELEARFRQVLERLCSEEPEHRFDEAAEVLQALESVVLPASEPSQA